MPATTAPYDPALVASAALEADGDHLALVLDLGPAGNIALELNPDALVELAQALAADEGGAVDADADAYLVLTANPDGTATVQASAGPLAVLAHLSLEAHLELHRAVKAAFAGLRPAGQLPGPVVDDAVAVYAEVARDLARPGLADTDRCRLLAAAEALRPVLLADGVDPAVLEPQQVAP